MKVGLFPGQGVEPRTILAALEAGTPLLAEANEVLGYDLRTKLERELRRSGPLDTSLGQPALFVAGVLGWRRALAEGRTFDAYVGHSLGEYTALFAAGAWSFEHALCVVAVRGATMRKAATASPGGMAAILGLDLEVVERLIGPGAVIANDNCPGQVVIAGDDGALAQAALRAAGQGGRCVRLKVAGAFHTRTMAPAVKPLADALDHVSIAAPKVPVISNVTARPYADAGAVSQLLVRQLCERVRFREAIEHLIGQGATQFEDLGPGRVAQGLVDRIGALDVVA